MYSGFLYSPLFRPRFGKVVNIGSNLVYNPVVTYYDYTAAKAALVGLTRNLAAELGPRAHVERLSLYLIEAVTVCTSGPQRSHPCRRRGQCMAGQRGPQAVGWPRLAESWRSLRRDLAVLWL